MKRIPLPNQAYALIDDCDFERCAQYRWSLSGAGYAQRTVGRTKQALHQLIVEAPAGMEVDHKDGNILDCRRANLRVCTKAQNNHNCRCKSNSTIGFKGVTKNGIGFAASLNWGKRVHLGTFSTSEAAARAYDKAAHSADPEFARLNFSDGIWSAEKLDLFRLSQAQKDGLTGAFKNGKKWTARIKRNGKQIHIGQFDTKEQAHEAYKNEKLKLDAQRVTK